MTTTVVERTSNLGFWAWLYRWKMTPYAIAYLFCITLIAPFVPAFAQLALGEASFAQGTFLVMIWLIPLTLYGFYKWKDRPELRE
ncbi:MAG: hypothetical protein KAW09_02675 [Thermoplasmata archaeon]|nr:hypothetical protein [Thermoplasmata archaeon]